MINVKRDVSKILWQKSRKKILFSVFGRRFYFKVGKKTQQKSLIAYYITCAENDMHFETNVVYYVWVQV